MYIYICRTSPAQTLNRRVYILNPPTCVNMNSKTKTRSLAFLKEGLGFRVSGLRRRLRGPKTLFSFWGGGRSFYVSELHIRPPVHLKVFVPRLAAQRDLNAPTSGTFRKCEGFIEGLESLRGLGFRAYGILKLQQGS